MDAKAVDTWAAIIENRRALGREVVVSFGPVTVEQ